MTEVTSIDDAISEVSEKLGDNPFVTIRDLINVGIAKSPTALFAMIKRGDLQAVRMGGRYIIPKNAVLDLIRQNVCKSQAESD